jgi:hypothetical protein
MSVLIDTRTGPVTQADGAGDQPIRQGRMGAIIMADGHGHFWESASRGFMFTASVGTAGVAPGTAIGTSAALGIYNPTNSGKNLVAIKSTAHYLSGTLGAGIIYFVGHQFNATLPGGTALTVQSNLVGAGAPSWGKAFSAATGLGVASLLRPFISVGAMTAESTTPNAPWQVMDTLDGEFVVPPGGALSIQAVGGAGTTPLMVFSMSWEEVPQ